MLIFSPYVPASRQIQVITYLNNFHFYQNKTWGYLCEIIEHPFKTSAFPRGRRVKTWPNLPMDKIVNNCWRRWVGSKIVKNCRHLQWMVYYLNSPNFFPFNNLCRKLTGITKIHEQDKVIKVILVHNCGIACAQWLTV